MKKAIIALIAMGVLSFGALSYAHMWGYGPGRGYQGEESGKFLDETADLRKQLHEKTFEYREAYRAGDEKKVEALEKEITGLQEKLHDKADAAGVSRGYGRGFGPGKHMWGYDQKGYGRGYGPGGYGCQGPYGW